MEWRRVYAWIPTESLKAIVRHVIESAAFLLAFWFLHRIALLALPPCSTSAAVADGIEEYLVVVTLGIFALVFLGHLLIGGVSALRKAQNAASVFSLVF